MFDYIQGTVVEKAEDYIVLDKGGFGFLIYTPDPSKFEKEAKVFIHLHLKEEEIKLYGFLYREERELFLKLLSIHGIGVKHAFAILSNMQVDEFIQAVETENTALLSSIPGIGKKTAHRLIVELKGKINFHKNQTLTELVEALTGLGYSRELSLKVASEVMKEKLTLEEALKRALIMINQ